MPLDRIIVAWVYKMLSYTLVGFRKHWRDFRKLVSPADCPPVIMYVGKNCKCFNNEPRN